MILKNIKIHNFRNYGKENLSFNRDLNIIYGLNAQGKTNLLEAISYLGLGGSFREKDNTNLVNIDEDIFFIEGEVENISSTFKISIGYNKLAKSRIIKLNNNYCKKVSEIIGLGHTVVFSPDDLGLVKRGPANRRLFLDREMSQLYNGYYNYLNTYKKCLFQRNVLIKKYSPALDLELDIWEEKMAVAAAQIIIKRAEFLSELLIISQKIQEKISLATDELNIIYEFSGQSDKLFKNMELSEIGIKKIEENLKEIYKSKRVEDNRRGITSIGPHRDDFEIFINGKSSKTFASQGQQRTAALALKLSEIELVYKIKGEYPIVLLDDVLSELDKGRQMALLNLMLNKAQVFITTTDETFDIENSSKYFVNQGKINHEK